MFLLTNRKVGLCSEGAVWIYWSLNADVFQAASVVVFIVWVCFPSMDLLKSVQHKLCSIILMYY